MTLPPEQIQVKCPGSGRSYETWHRASFNMTLGEHFDDEYIHKMTHAICPHCKAEVALSSLIVDRKGVFTFRE